MRSGNGEGRELFAIMTFNIGLLKYTGVNAVIAYIPFRRTDRLAGI
jgi:hypothetical protein